MKIFFRKLKNSISRPEIVACILFSKIDSSCLHSMLSPKSHRYFKWYFPSIWYWAKLLRLTKSTPSRCGLALIAQGVVWKKFHSWTPLVGDIFFINDRLLNLVLFNYFLRCDKMSLSFRLDLLFNTRSDYQTLWKVR